MEFGEQRISKLAHDLRTPLTIIQGFSELLLRSRDRITDEQVDEYLGRIADATVEMKDILDAERAERLAFDDEARG